MSILDFLQNGSARDRGDSFSLLGRMLGGGGMDDALEEEKRRLALMEQRSIEAARGAEMRSHDPSFRESMVSGMGRVGDYIGAPHMRSDTANLVNDFAPGISTAASFDDAKQAAQGGRYGAAAGNAALGLLDVVPGAGALAGAGMGLASKAGRGIMERLGAEAAPATDNVVNAFHNVDGTLGDLNNPSVKFEGVSPHDFTPDQWGRFGQQYGVENLGPLDAAEWEASLVPLTTKSGRQITVPGGLEDKPFTYYDLLHMKKQGINPNDLDPAVHQQIHNRFLTTMSPGGEVSPERLMNQMSLAQISPNQPLTPNELAVARTMVKGPKDLQKFGEMVPWSFRDSDEVSGAKDVMSTRVDPDSGKTLKTTRRQQVGTDIANQFGLGAGAKGGLGARGTADYTRLAETAQRLGVDPDFFRFRGADEGGKTSAENWANFVERLANQTPGLSAKTGSFGAVWQNPKGANISAVDRHMAGMFTSEMFPSREAYDKFQADSLAKYNKEAKKKADSYAKIPQTKRNDYMFSYLNNTPNTKMRLKPEKGSNSGVGAINPKVPEHLREDMAKWIDEPEYVAQISDAYRRVLDANAEHANAAGQSIFGSQWMLWDRIRNRLEPHEVMFPGLEKLPRMSMDQMHTARRALSDAGYMSGSKDDEGLQAVRELPSASMGGYFSHPAATAGGAAIGAGALYKTQKEREEAERRRSLLDRLMGGGA